MSAPRIVPGRMDSSGPRDRRATLAALLTEVAQQLAAEPAKPEPEPATRVMPERVLLTPEEAGELLGVGRSTVYALMKAGDLKSVQIGRLRRIPTSAVHDYAARLIAQTP